MRDIEIGGSDFVVMAGHRTLRRPETIRMLRTLNGSGKLLSLIAIPSEASWGKASSDLVKAVYQEHVLALIALDRPSSHLAEPIAVKSFVPLVGYLVRPRPHLNQHPLDLRFAVRHYPQQALRTLSAAIDKAGPNRTTIRELLSSGAPLAGLRFRSKGE